MSVKRIASRYAKSIIDLATERGELETILSDMKVFNKIAENRDVKMLLKSPIVSVDRKKGVFNALFGERLSKTTQAFFDIVLRKGRESYLQPIADEFILQYKTLKGISDVKITTAAPLTEEVLAKIKQSLLSSDVTAQNVELETAVDPEIIGGFILEVEDKLYDDSVAHRLDQMKKNFSDNQFVSKI